MTERERLIELLNKSCEERGWIMNGAKTIADYLLENGVIVSPCKVGDTVYAISRGAIIPITIDRIQYSNRGIDILGRNERYFGYGTITLHPDNKIGLEWYKTKEEAEQALEEKINERNTF